MKNILALLVFIILQILFIPLAIIGFILVAYKQLVVSKNLGVSQTAIEIINGRWTMHIFGLRDDNAAAKLTPVLPNTSTFGLWLVLAPLYIYYRISGQNRWYPAIAEDGEEGLDKLIINRTVYFDRIINRAKGEAEQFVVLGAGLDTRAYNDLKHSGLEIFELDQAATQQHKRKYLQIFGHLESATLTNCDSLTPRAPDKCGRSAALSGKRPQTADSASGSFVRQIPPLPVTPAVGHSRTAVACFEQDSVRTMQISV